MNKIKLVAEMTWQELRSAAEAGAVALLPAGSTEQHGPHLPVKTDTLLVMSVARAAVEELPESIPVVVAPTLRFGASDHHTPFFALSVDERTYIDMVTQVGLCLAEAGFRRLFILNGHGGNSASIRLALIEMRKRRPDFVVAAAEYWSLAAAELAEVRSSGPGGIAHSGEFETSLVMHLEPGSVRVDRLETSVPRLPGEFTLDLTQGGPVALNLAWNRMSGRGVLGDPTEASREKGEAFFDAAVRAVRVAIESFYRLDVDRILPDSGAR
jgi:creatinine amidohydrolase